MTTYPVGAFFVTTVPGRLGFAIALGQLLAGKPSEYMHAGIITSPDGATVEAEPGGARTGHISDYAGRPLLVSDAPVKRAVQNYTVRRGTAISGPPEWFDDIQRRHVVDAARSLIGTPYSALDYLALALLHLHLPSRWVRQRVESSGHLICSALVDAVYRRAGIHLFTDDRLSGDVLPADLAAWADAHQPVTA